MKELKTPALISVAPDSGGGAWSVDSSGKLKDESVIISVDGVKYKTISEAEAAMTEDSVIILLKDVSLKPLDSA